MLKEMILERSRKHREMLYPLSAFVAAAIMAYSGAGMMTSPLICAFVGAFAPICAMAFSIGGILTYLTAESITENAFIMCAFVLITVGKWLLREDNTPKNAAFITFVSMAFSGLVFGFLMDRSPMQALVNVVLALAGAVGAYFVRETVDAFESGIEVFQDKRILIALGGVFVLIVTMLSGLSFSVVNAGAVIGCVVTLCAKLW